MYEDWLITFYNLFFTAGPIGMISWFEQDIPLYERKETISQGKPVY